MTQTHPIRLHADEINHQAHKFFGPGNLGLSLDIDEPHRLRFQGREGFVELDIRPDTNNQVRLKIQHQGYTGEIQKFRRLLARQATAETKQPQ